MTSSGVRLRVWSGTENWSLKKSVLRVIHYFPHSHVQLAWKYLSMSLFSLEALKILEPDTCLKPPISVQVSKTSTHVSWSLVINEETLWQKYCVSLLVFAQISEKSEVGWAVRFPDLKAMERASRELKQGQFSWDSPCSTSLEFS